MHKFVDLSFQYGEIKEQVEEKIIQIARSGMYESGKEVSLFEQKLSGYLGAKYVIGTSDGTSSLIVALETLGIGEGDEVITTAFTFFATAASIIKVGATPVFVDIDIDTYNIDVNKIEEKITEKTKAILPVHIFGNPCDMVAINRIAKKHGLFVIEDMCQAIGAEIQDKKVGNWSDIACLSFFLTKNLGAFGEAGAIITNNEAYAKISRALIGHGAGNIGREAYILNNDNIDETTTFIEEKYRHYLVGYNSRMDEIQAAVLNIKIDYLDEWIKRRQENAMCYKENLNIGYKTQLSYQGCKNVYHIFSIECEDRNKVREVLMNEGFATGIHYPVPVHLQPALKYLDYKKGSLPVTESICEKILSLPIYPGLDMKNIMKIIEVLNAF